MPSEKKNISTGSKGINFILNPDEGYLIKGVVTDSQGNPINKVRIEAWSDSLNILGGIWAVTDRSGVYELKGVPESDDYVIKVYPPKESSLAFFSESDISVPLEDDKNIMLSQGVIISGTVKDKNSGEAVKNLEVTAVSEGNLFQSKTETDKSGYYEITNLPADALYHIKVFGGGSYIGARKLNISPGYGIDFLMESSGSITGNVIEKSTGKFYKNAVVEAYSVSMQGITGFSGTGVTDKDGNFVINELRKRDPSGNLINDYNISVYASGYPAVSMGARKVADVVNFQVTRGPENEISGTVTGYNGELIEGADFTAEIFESGSKYIKCISVNNDGSFNFSGLDPDKKYQLKFSVFIGDNEVLSEWSGEGEPGLYDLGVENPDDPYEPPATANVYKTDITVHFRFSKEVRSQESGIRSQESGAERPGAVNNLHSLSHVESKILGVSERMAISSGSHTGMASNNPFITVSWEPSDPSSDEGYYYEFNEIPDHIITKRNVPDIPPTLMRQVTSGELSGDNVSFYFHVAAVDDRGRIGATSTQAFLIDTVPPSNGNVVTPETTSNQMITLFLGVMDAKEMYISNYGYGKNNEWETRVKEKSWQLTEGNGIKEIFIQFRDEAGNISNYTVSTQLTSSDKCTDADGDGFYAEFDCDTEQDCDDNDKAVYQGASEICNDKKDNDCDSLTDCA